MIQKYIYKPDILANRMYNGYLERIINFIGKLHPQVQKDLLIRIIGLDCWSLKKKILKYHPNVNFCDENTKIKKIYNNSKFVISTHLGTTMLEALLSNIPTCILIDDSEFEVVANKKKQYYKLLQNVDILHTNLSKCSEHINNLFLKDDIDNWWNSVHNKKSLKEFNDNICFYNPNLKEDLINIIKK